MDGREVIVDRESRFQNLFIPIEKVQNSRFPLLIQSTSETFTKFLLIGMIYNMSRSKSESNQR